MKGRRGGNHKLTPTKVREIREAFDKGIPTRVLANKYNMSLQGIRDVGERRTWKDVK